MGTQKRIIDLMHLQNDAVIEISIESKVLARCPHHQDIYSISDDITSAYKLGSWKINNGMLSGIFSDHKALREEIKEVTDSYALIESCPSCHKIDFL